MTENRFKHMLNRLGMQFICYDDREILLGTFADADGITEIVDLLNEQHKTIQQQKEAIEHLSYDCEYIQNIIKEAYETERTSLGKSVLKQLLEAIQ